MYRVHLYMAHFGARSMKATWLYSNYEHIQKIHEFRTHPGASEAAENKPQVTIITADRGGRLRVSGGPDLKATQAYTEGFGEAVAKTFASGAADVLDRVKQLRAEAGSYNFTADSLRMVPLKTRRDRWHDADLRPILKMLMEPASDQQ